MSLADSVLKMCQTETDRKEEMIPIFGELRTLYSLSKGIIIKIISKLIEKNNLKSNNSLVHFIFPKMGIYDTLYKFTHNACRDIN